MTLSEAKANTKATILSLSDCDLHQLNRLASIGLTQGTSVLVVKNDRKMPVMIYARETLMALNRRDAERIEVEPL